MFLCLCLWSFPFLVLADTSFVWSCYCCSFVLDCYIVWCFCMKLLVIASSLLFQQLYMIIILSLWIPFFEVWSGDSGRLWKDISLGDLHLFFYAAVNMAVEWSWCFFLNKLSCFYIFSCICDPFGGRESSCHMPQYLCLWILCALSETWGSPVMWYLASWSSRKSRKLFWLI